MHTDTSSSTIVNPFTSRRIRPGAIEYVFSEGNSARDLLRRLREQGWWGAITGPHGSGKSTLLHSLLPHLEHAGRHIELAALTPGHRKLPFSPAQTRQWNDRTQVVVDGYEQLSWLNQLRLKLSCRRQRAGLLITAHTHHPLGIPQLIESIPALATVRRIVATLLAEQPQFIADDDIVRLFEEHAGNVREILFGLYDVVEAGRWNRSLR